MAKITNKSILTSKYITPDGQQLEYQVESNQSSIENMTVSFLKEKSSSQDFAFPSNEIEISLKLTNNSDVEISNISITDNVSSGAVFKPSSIMIDGVPQPNFEITGFNLPNALQTGSETVVSYVIVVDENPTETEINITSTINYQANGVALTESLEDLTISLQNQEITIQNTSDKTAVVSGQVIVFQNDIQNKGTVVNTQCMFTSPIPTGTTFVEGSVEIDGQKQANFNPSDGFLIGDLEVGSKKIIKFCVTVD